jgi:ABC-type sugar transport system substrate-binding protein
LSTSHKLRIAAVICQNDDMAQGVHDAFETCLSGDERAQWLSLPVTGCDGLPNGGVEMVKRGVLAATIIVPANAGTAMELVVRALNGQQVPERTICEVSSYPSEDKLRRVAAAKFAS